MTKLGFKTFIVSAVIASSTVSFAAQQATSSALSAYESLKVDDLQTSTAYSQSIVHLLANNKTLQSFKNSHSNTVSVNGKLQVNRSGNDPTGQCVTFVKSIANFSTHTSNWIKGTQVTQGAYIPKGTVVATFDENGKYGPPPDKKSSYGHAAIVIRIDNNGMMVMDQNWAGQNVSFHTIRFDGTGVNKASNYYVVN